MYYTMFTLWNKPPLRTLALQPGKCDAVKKVVPSRIVASPSYTISTPHKPQPSPISPLFTSAQDATCTPAATSKNDDDDESDDNDGDDGDDDDDNEDVGDDVVNKEAGEK